MNIFTKQLKLEDLSNIQYEVHTGTSRVVDYLEIMILKFIGDYGYGSAGNSDATYMSAIGKAVLEAWEPGGLIIDLSDLSYEWGIELKASFCWRRKIFRHTVSSSINCRAQIRRGY